MDYHSAMHDGQEAFEMKKAYLDVSFSSSIPSPEGMHEPDYSGTRDAPNFSMGEEGGELATPGKLGEIMHALKSVVNLNQAIAMKRLGKVGANVAKASQIATQNGEKILGLVEDFYVLLTFDSLSQAKKGVKILGLMEGLVESQRPRLAQRGVALTFDAQLAPQTKVHLSPQAWSFLITQLIEKVALSTADGMEIKVLLKPCQHQGRIALQIMTSGAVWSLPSPGEKGGANPESSSGMLFRLLRRYITELGGQVAVDLRSNFQQQIAVSLPIYIAPAVDTPLPPASQVASYGPTLRPPHPKQLSHTPVALLVGNDPELYPLVSGKLVQSCPSKFSRCTTEALNLCKAYPQQIRYILCFGDLATRNDLEGLNLFRQQLSSEIPIFLLTYDARISQKIQAQMLGARHYFIMPGCQKQMLANIQSALAAPSVPCANPPRSIAKDDLAWLIEMEDLIEQQMGTQYFNLMELAYQLAISERQLFRKVKELTGKTPNKYLRDLKLHRARTLLKEYSCKTVAEISYAVGFQDPHYFSKIYKNHFGKWPSEYLVKH